MEQSDSTGEVTPYELATLASRICPKRCASNPKEAIAGAERLLKEADAAISWAYQEAKTKEFFEDEARQPRINWVDALKQVTGQKRRDRAVKHYLQYVENEGPHGNHGQQWLEQGKREGFTPYQVDCLKDYFTRWLNKPKHKKGKQGRRISEHDGRLRTDLLGLMLRKPRKRS